MRILLIAPSVTASRGEAHFHRGLLQELAFYGHDARAVCPAPLVEPIAELAERVPLSADYPGVAAREPCTDADVEAEAAEADLVLVHDRTPEPLRARLVRSRRAGVRARLLLHDTHARTPDPGELCSPLEAEGFDGVLAACGTLADAYARQGWGRRVLRWAPGADTRAFAPLSPPCTDADVLVLGHWGPRRLQADFIRWVLDPLRQAGVRATVTGSGYPLPLQERLQTMGIAPPRAALNTALPELFSRHRAVVPLPLPGSGLDLPGRPPLAMLEAMACGMPVIRGLWPDMGDCFEAGEDHLAAASPEMMRAQIQRVLLDRTLADRLGHRARVRVTRRHSCIARADELLAFAQTLRAGPDAPLRPRLHA
ncbi:glycosyltransferase [Glycocaulis profundi]|nr:glycosyltransferase [Glycocaulis profundi]